MIFPLISQESDIDKNIIETYVYNSTNYIRSPLFEEQDLIYKRTFEFEPGLELICEQDKVKVEINGYETLYTPVDLNNIPAGDYIIKMNKTGYYPSEFRISVSTNERTSVFVKLARYSTQLTLKDLPENAVVYINNHKVDDYTVEIPLGANYLRISAFGYEDYIEVIDVDDIEELVLKPELIKRDFAFSNVTLNRPTIWTNDSRSMKRSKITIYADAPGSGKISIIDPVKGSIIESKRLEFTEAETDFIFDLENYKSIEPGDYLILIEGENHQVSDQMESSLSIKEGIKSVWRNNFTGFSGFLFASTAETLPVGNGQFQTIVSPIFNSSSIEDLYIPAIMSLRISIIRNLELAIGAGLYISPEMNETSLDLFLSGKYAFFTTDGSDGFSLAAGLSLNYNGKTSSFEMVPDYDPFSGLTGLSIILPMQYRMGPLLFVLTPEIKISPSFPGIENSGFTAGSIYIWNYIRAAVSLDFGEISTALSASLQSPSYINSNSQWPLFLGLELSSTPGNSGFSFSIYGGIRYINGESLQITSGLSAGFIF